MQNNIIWIYGAGGTGKTTLANFIQQHSHDVDFQVIDPFEPHNKAQKESLWEAIGEKIPTIIFAQTEPPSALSYRKPSGILNLRLSKS